jgi:tRNA nucleotidyltransferase/poly(A) polymerase
MPLMPLPAHLLQILPSAPTAYLVGGTVRDLLMQRHPTDVDIAVKGDAAAFAEALAARAGKRAAAVGKAHRVTYRIAAGDLLIDVTGLTGGSLENDLRRRDFTINAMAYDPAGDRLADPLGGLDDMAARRVRMVAETAFVEDPLRLLRAFRLAAVLDFSIVPETLAAIARHARRIDQTAGERLRHELLQLLACPASAGQVLSMSGCGLLVRLLPELAPLQGCGQNVHHDFDVYDHTLKAYARLETALEEAGRLPRALSERYRQAPFRRRTLAVLKYALLLHDIGKPGTRRVDADGAVHFHGHARRSMEMAGAVHQRLRLSREERDQARCIIANHGRPMDLMSAHRAGNLTRRGLNRFFRDCEPWTPEVLLHALGDTLGKRAAPDAAVETTLAFIRDLLEDYFDRFRPLADRQPLLSGRDLLDRFDLAPSPLIGKLLAAVEEERLAGRIATRDEALAFAGKFLAQNTDQ